MKKYRDQDYWFEIGQAPDASGRMARNYIVRCRKCATTASYHASGIANEKMRKLFVRDGWQIGKWRNQHVCSVCSKKVHKQESAQIAVPLKVVWDQYSPNDRAEFIKWLLGDGWQHNFKDSYDRKRFIHWMNCAGWVPAADVKDIIWAVSRTPPEPSTPPPEPESSHLRIIEPEPEPEPEPERELETVGEASDASDDEPADWWKELMSK